LIREPEVLFLDEPCASLDGRATREIETLLLQARADGTRIIMATHDVGQARRLASEVLFILQGKLHEFSPAEVFFENAKTDAARAFLNGDIIE
jgi:tungstate transport system ATP-binding protein